MNRIEGDSIFGYGLIGGGYMLFTESDYHGILVLSKLIVVFKYSSVVYTI